MEEQDNQLSPGQIDNLIRENKKLKKQLFSYKAFALVVVIVQLYDLIAGMLEK